MQANHCLRAESAGEYSVDTEERRLIVEFAHRIRTPMQTMLNCSAVLEMVPPDSLEFQRALAALVCNLTVQAELIEELLRPTIP